MFVKTLRVQKLVQHFRLCQAQLQEGGSFLWSKPGYPIKPAVASIACVEGL